MLASCGPGLVQICVFAGADQIVHSLTEARLTSEMQLCFLDKSESRGMTGMSEGKWWARSSFQILKKSREPERNRSC